MRMEVKDICFMRRVWRVGLNTQVIVIVHLVEENFSSRFTNILTGCSCVVACGFTLVPVEITVLAGCSRNKSGHGFHAANQLGPAPIGLLRNLQKNQNLNLQKQYSNVLIAWQMKQTINSLNTS